MMAMKTSANASTPSTTHAAVDSDPVLLDLRDLEPPEPLRIALEALATLPSGATLIARTRFRPVHLLSVLDDRGFAWETAGLGDASWETTITATAGSSETP